MTNEPDQQESQETARWLQQRLRSGNWFDIAETDVIPTDIEGPFSLILQMFQTAFAPEIRKRTSSGKLDGNFVLTAAQLIQPVTGRRTVRLNDEVRGLMVVHATRPIQKGGPVFLSDLQQFEGFDLEVDELDSGHFTVFWNGEGWVASFDFRAGRAKSAGMLDAASEFLQAAQFAAERRLARPSVDNLFSACEHVAKAQLILYHNRAARAKTHRTVHSAINSWGRLGNVNEDFLELFNRISNARAAARYKTGAQVELPSASDMQVVRREIEHLREAVAQRTVAFYKNRDRAIEA